MKRRALLVLALTCYSFMAVVIVLDEVLFRIVGNPFYRMNTLISIGYHTLNLQSLIGIGFYFLGEITLIVLLKKGVSR